MLESFIRYFESGLYHILNFDSYDHILFVIIISVPFTFKDWKRLLILISIFSLGHTLSLLLGLYDALNLKVNITEWLIPLTIFLMAFYNIFTAGKLSQRLYFSYGVVLFFGLIHGLGFANAFERLLDSNDSTLLSVIEFAIGIEIGQCIVVLFVLILSFIAQSIFRFSNRDWVLVISSIILGFISPLIFMGPLFS